MNRGSSDTSLLSAIIAAVNSGSDESTTGGIETALFGSSN